MSSAIGLPKEMYMDLVMLKGDLITMDETNPHAESIAIKNGRIVKVGSDREIERMIGKNTKVIDLEGKTVVPGFYDTHVHMISYGNWLAGWHVDLRYPAVRSIAEIQEKVRKKAQKVPESTWIKGRGYDTFKLLEKQEPNRWDLDEAAPKHPVFLLEFSAHSCAVNSKALELAKITKDTPDPEGGEIDRDPTGEPTGVLRSTAMELVRTVIPVYSVEEIRESIKVVCKEFVKYGITSATVVTGRPINGGGGGTNDCRAFQEALDHGELPIRIKLMIWEGILSDLLIHEKKGLGLRTGFGSDRLKIGPIKLFMDGTFLNVPATPALSEPYVGDPNNRGILRMNQEELDKMVSEAHETGWQVAIHAEGDRAIDMSLKAIEAALKEKPRRNHRHRLEHCGMLNEEMINRIKRLGIIMVAQPLFITLDLLENDRFTEILGPERTRLFKPWKRLKSLMDKNIKISGSSDCPGTHPSPLLGIYAATSLYPPEERITVEEAIRMYTLSAAYASFEEDIKGSIEAGKVADLVVLSANPLTIPPNKIKDVEILKTIVGGEVVYNKDYVQSTKSQASSSISRC